MDPDPGGYWTSSALLKTTVLTVTFSTIAFYRTENQTDTFQFEELKETPVAVQKKASAVKKKKKTIYFTFDDGPNKGTRNVRAIINTEKVPVTLFVIGEHVYASNLQRNMYDSTSADSLFEIANHSYTHGNHNRFAHFYAGDSVVSDFKRCSDSLDLTSGIIRTPGRNIWRLNRIRQTDIRSSAPAADSLEKHGYKILGWDLEWHFEGNRTVQTKEAMIRQIDSAFARNTMKTQDHLVLLAHDQAYVSSVDSMSLHQLISELKARDEFDFETVSKYPGIAADQ